MENLTATDDSDTLSRAEAAQRLGLSVSAIRRREGTLLHPIIGEGGEHRFSTAEVERLAKDLATTGSPPAAASTNVDAAPVAPGEDDEVQNAGQASDHADRVEDVTQGATKLVAEAQVDGEIAALIFADLQAGKALTDIVIARRLTPEIVGRWHAEWQRLRDIDGARRPEIELRLRAAEVMIGVYGRAAQVVSDHVGRLERRLAAVEGGMGQLG